MIDNLSLEEQQLINDILGETPRIEIPYLLPLNNIDYENNSIPQSPTRNLNSGRLFSPSSPIISSINLKKCCILYIGGPNLKLGQTTDPLSPMCCSNLFCINCDHKVLRFPDYKWASTTNYLFLRNHYPNKVHQNLIRTIGTCSYCCQCTFCEETKNKHLDNFESKWVCRGHK